MTRDELKANIKVEFEDSANFLELDYDTAIQDGYEEIVATSGCIFKSATIPFEKDLTYYDLRSEIPDFLGVVAIFNPVTRFYLCPLSLRKLDQERSDWECNYGTPEYFCPISHRAMAIYKKPAIEDYGDMYIFYRATAPILSGGTTILIPDDHIKVLENYSFLDLHDRRQEYAKASTVFTDYIKRLEQFRQSVVNQRITDRLSSLK